MKYYALVNQTQNPSLITAVVAATSSPGDDWVEVSEGVSPETHYWNNGVVAYTPEQLARKQASQPGLEWDVTLMEWVDRRTLAEYKAAKIADIRREAISRIRDRFPALSSVDEIKLIREFWLSIAPAARQPTSDFSWLILMWQTVHTVVSAVSAASDRAAVDAITPTWPT
jgi:hypothetical protein